MTQTITGLTPLSNLPRTREIPTGIGSGNDFKATGQQVVDMVQTGNTAIHNTSVTLTAAEIFAGFVRSDTSSGDVTLNMPTAANIYAQFGSSPPIGTYQDCKFGNISTPHNIVIDSADPNLLATGLVSTIISSLKTINIRFTVTQLTPAIQITMDGGENDAYQIITGGSFDGAPIGSISPPNATLNNLTINGTFTWPIVSANSLFVDANGSNSNSGSQYKPYKTIFYAVQQFNQFQIIKIGEGDFTETSAIVIIPTTTFYGNGQNDTQILSSGFSISANWPDISSPYIYIQNLLISDSNGINLIAPVAAANSSINLSNVLIDPTEQPLSVGMVYNSNFSNNVQATNVTLQDIGNFKCIGSNLIGTLTINCLDQTDFPTQNYYIDGSSLTQIIVNSSLGVNVTVTVLNSPNLSNFTSSVSGGTITYNFDTVSYPTNFSLSGGEIINNLDRAYLLNNTKGLSVNFQDCSWTGDGSVSGNAYTFMAGRGAHTTGGTDNILLGKSATSNWIGTFIFCDSTNTTGGAYFPQGNNQAVFFASGGFGVNCNSGSGILGPKASFHAGGFYGDGNFLFSCKGVVTAGNVQNQEANPVITADVFSLNYRGATGTYSTLTFPSLGGSIAPTNNTVLTGLTAITNVQITSGYVVDSMVFPNIKSTYTATGTINAADLYNKTITCNSATPITLTLPTASSFTLQFPIAPPASSALEGLTITNLGSGTVTIAAGSGFTLDGMPNTVVAALTTKYGKILVTSSTPTFALYI